MFTGRDALSSVEQAISQARSDERGLDTALRSAAEESAQFKREEADGFRALARVRLDALVREKVIGDLDAAEQQALALLENHRREIEDLARRRDECQSALDRAEAAKHDRDQELADALEALDELKDKTAERIKGDPRWHDAKEAVEEAEEIAENADEKATLAESDLAEKGKPYADDPLFIYLWTKKHAQAQDPSGAFVRFFDRKVARLVGYSGARANYAMLREIPARLREHAKNKQNDVEEAKRKVAVIEREALVADGVEPLEAKVEAAYAAMKAAEDAVLKITAELSRIDADHEKLVASDDENGEGRAVDLLAQALAREDLSELLRDASRTPTKSDDQAISAIAAARTAREKADTEVRQIRGDIREMAKRRIELEGARDRARSIGYDDPRGRFDGGQDIILQVIGGILAGALRGYALDRVLRDTFRPGRRRDYDMGRWGEMGPGGLPGPWGGLPPTLPGPWGGLPGGLPGPWGGGGGGRGGGWKTGGRMGGGGGGKGGWKTGGRF
jgi:hypothetical protein